MNNESEIYTVPLHKVTVYIADLDGTLEEGDIKTRIKERALNSGCANCVVHFADYTRGPEVPWDDDIDLNFNTTPTEAWERYFKESGR